MTTHDGRMLAHHAGEDFYVDRMGERVAEVPALPDKIDAGKGLEVRELNPWSTGYMPRYRLEYEGKPVSREFQMAEWDATTRSWEIWLNGKRGIIHQSGRILFPLGSEYEAFSHNAAGYVEAKAKDGESLFFDVNGNELLEAARQSLLKDYADKLARESEGANDAKLGPRVICVNPQAESWDMRYILVNGSNKSQKYQSIRIDEDSGIAVVKHGLRERLQDGRGHGLIDMQGREIISSKGPYRDFKIGDPLVLASRNAFTLCHEPRSVYGYFTHEGRDALPFQHARATLFRGGQAWVAKQVSNPDLVHFKHPEAWFVDNRTVFRSGDGEGSCIQSVRTSGKYAAIYSGTFKNGKLNSQGTLADPRYGRTIGTFESGESVGTVIHYTIEGTKIQAPMLNGRPHGQGHSERYDGTLEFVGEFRNGEKWSGSGYLPDRDDVREHWENGKMLGMRKTGYAYKPKVKPKPKSSGPKSYACPSCNGRGKVVQDAIYEKVPHTSLIMAGDKYYGSRYTHYVDPDKTTTRVVDQGGYVSCSRCNGSGYVQK